MSTYYPATRPLTYRQRCALDLWMRYGRKSKARALREAGYSEAIVRQPHKVFDSPAIRLELELRGRGPDGTRNNQPPRAIVLNAQPQGLNVDFSTLTTEMLQELRQKLADLPEVTWIPQPAPDTTPRIGSRPGTLVESEPPDVAPSTYRLSPHCNPTVTAKMLETSQKSGIMKAIEKVSNFM